MEKCRPALVVVHQTNIAATAVEEKPNDTLSVPYGLIRTVRHYLEFVGILRYIRGLKTKGVRLDLIVVALCTYTMYASNSMNAYAEWLENPSCQETAGVLGLGGDLATHTQQDVGDTRAEQGGDHLRALERHKEPVRDQ